MSANFNPFETTEEQAVKPAVSSPMYVPHDVLLQVILMIAVVYVQINAQKLKD